MDLQACTRTLPLLSLSLSLTRPRFTPSFRSSLYFSLFVLSTHRRRRPCVQHRACVLPTTTYPFTLYPFPPPFVPFLLTPFIHVTTTHPPPSPKLLCKSNKIRLKIQKYKNNIFPSSKGQLNKYLFRLASRPDPPAVCVFFSLLSPLSLSFSLSLLPLSHQTKKSSQEGERNDGRKKKKKTTKKGGDATNVSIFSSPGQRREGGKGRFTLVARVRSTVTISISKIFDIFFRKMNGKMLLFSFMFVKLSLFCPPPPFSLSLSPPSPHPPTPFSPTPHPHPVWSETSQPCSRP